jgi:hypothetical protein
MSHAMQLPELAFHLLASNTTKTAHDDTLRSLDRVQGCGVSVWWLNFEGSVVMVLFRGKNA